MVQGVCTRLILLFITYTVIGYRVCYYFGPCFDVTYFYVCPSFGWLFNRLILLLPRPFDLFVCFSVIQLTYLYASPSFSCLLCMLFLHLIHRNSSSSDNLFVYVSFIQLTYLHVSPSFSWLICMFLPHSVDLLGCVSLIQLTYLYAFPSFNSSSSSSLCG